MKSLYYNITRGVRNLFRWFSTIWQLRDWDFGFTEDFARKQISYTRRCLEQSQSRSVGFTTDEIEDTTDIYIQSMQICEKILQRRRDNWYLRNAPAWYPTIEENTESGMHIFIIPNDTEWDEFGILSDNVEQQDWKWLWNIVRDYGQGWRD